MLFRKKPKIEVVVRHCFFSNASIHKTRPSYFDRESCFKNILETKVTNSVQFTFFLDTFYAKNQTHFLEKQTKFPVIKIHAGAEAKSFLQMLDWATQQPFNDDTILYFLEDDYLHRQGWDRVLAEGFSVEETSYVTLYDHRDKYLENYRDIKSKIFFTDSCHWRTVPSTTNTYAMKFSTLKRDLSIHREFSLNRTITADHEKFCKLNEKGAILISSIPGFSTHLETEYLSPCFNWESLSI
ncbi:MAG: hypothetical protein L0207_02640 [Chlamydiae bacterium]|nr:hypothetical protein [Chlamydiota bacterium]